MRELRIGVVTPYPPSTTTLVEYGQHLVGAIARQPEVAEVVVLTDELPEGEYGEAPAGVRFAPCWRFNGLTNPLRIARTVRRERLDAVIWNVQFASFGDQRVPAALGLAGPAVLRAMGVPTVALLHNIMETVDLANAGYDMHPLVERVVRLAGRVVTRLVLRADVVALTMPQYVDVLREEYDADNVALIPHGTFDVPGDVDTDVPAGPAQLLAFGKFGTYKKVEPLLEAARRLRGDHDIEVVVAGTDSPNARGYLESVRAQYGEDGVRFTGYVAEEDVPTVFGEASVVVFPYTSTTGSSGVVHQAASYGRALVMPEIGDFRRLVEAEGYVGEYFDPDDTDTLTAAIDTILRSPETRVAQGRRNHAVAAGLPMDDIAGWYLEHVLHLTEATM